MENPMIDKILKDQSITKVLDSSQSSLKGSFLLSQKFGGSSKLKCKLQFHSFGRCEGDSELSLRLNFDVEWDDLYGSLPLDEDKTEEIEDIVRDELQDEDLHEVSLHDLLVQHGVSDGLDNVAIAVSVNGEVQRSIYGSWTSQD